MHTRATVTAALIAFAAMGQTPAEANLNRVFQLSHTETAQDLQEVAAVVRTVADLPRVSVDTERKSLVVHGPASRVSLAEWLVNELDRPASPAALAAPGLSPVTREYPGSGGDVVGVFRLARAGNPRQLQESATLVGNLAEIERVVPCYSQRIVVLRGSSTQMELVAWLFTGIDSPGAGSRAREFQREFQMPGGANDLVRVLPVTNAGSVRDLQEIATLVRSAVEVPRLFVNTAPALLALRGTEEQAAMAEWLVNAVDQQPGSRPAPAKEYRTSGGGGDDIIRVVHFANAATVQDFQEATTLVRAITAIPHLFIYNAPRIVALRGTASQMALSGWLFKELDRPANAETSGRAAEIHEYRVSGGGDDIVRVFYVPAVPTPGDLQQLAVRVRTQTAARRLFTCNARKLIALRGTTEQTAQAARLIEESTK
jgi:hypothetical protein